MFEKAKTFRKIIRMVKVDHLLQGMPERRRKLKEEAKRLTAEYEALKKEVSAVDALAK